MARGRFTTMLIACALLGGCGAMNVEERARAYRGQEAQMRVAEYGRARARGDLIDMCVRANLVSAAYRDAGDEANAGVWDARRAEDCAMAHALVAEVAPQGDAMAD